MTNEAHRSEESDFERLVGGTPPNMEGWWEYRDEHGELHEVEVYLHPVGWLCVWCDDVGAAGYEQIFTDGDDIYGHIPVQYHSEWTGRFIKPLSAR